MILDKAALARLTEDLGGDVATVKELVASLGAEAPQLLVQGRTSTKAGDAATCQRAYHTLKGTAATFGLSDLAEACRAIEQAAKVGTLPAEAAMGEVDRLWALSWAELRAAVGT